MFEAIISGITTLGTLIVVLFLCYYATKYVGTIHKSRGMSGNIKILDQVFVGQDKAIAIIKVAGEVMLVGITSGRISVLKELNEQDLEEIKMPEPVSFKAIFDKMGKKEQSE